MFIGHDTRPICMGCIYLLSPCDALKMMMSKLLYFYICTARGNSTEAKEVNVTMILTACQRLRLTVKRYGQIILLLSLSVSKF